MAQYLLQSNSSDCLGIHGWNLGGVRAKVDFEFVLLREWLPVVQAQNPLVNVRGVGGGERERQPCLFILMKGGTARKKASFLQVTFPYFQVQRQDAKQAASTS